MCSVPERTIILHDALVSLIPSRFAPWERVALGTGFLKGTRLKSSVAIGPTQNKE